MNSKIILSSVGLNFKILPLNGNVHFSFQFTCLYFGQIHKRNAKYSFLAILFKTFCFIAVFISIITLSNYLPCKNAKLSKKQ